MKWLTENLLIFAAKVWGLWWVFVATPFRAYARSVVYNYVLQREKRQWLSRLWQRQPNWSFYINGWVMTGHVFGHLRPDETGFVRLRRVSALEFYLVVFFIWGWLDDDSMEDTTSRDYIETLLTGSRKDSLMARLFRPLLKRAKLKRVPSGNAFDLGDARAKSPYFNVVTTLFWNTRNSAMNFQYLWAGY
ncbi:MAG TPA: hypothetical protein VKA50_11880 [Gammaproteobacteria bacterium]|nr:hypothetical protein [Gammaproteobacteria bacterium]